MQRDFKALKVYVHRMITAARLTKGCRPMTRRSWRWIGIVLGVGIALSSSTPSAADEALLNGVSSTMRWTISMPTLMINWTA